MNHIDILKKSQLFSNIEKHDIAETLSRLNPIYKSYKKGEYIIRAGQKVEHLGIILNGKAHILKEDYWGRTSIITEITQANIFAEVFASLSEESQVSVLAITDLDLVFISPKKITNSCPKNCNFHNRLINNLLISIARKNINITQKLIHVGMKTTRDKLLSYLSSQALKNSSTEFKIPFNRQDLSNYLGVDRSALSTEIGKLQREGIIKTKKNHFQILKPELDPQ